MKELKKRSEENAVTHAAAPTVAGTERGGLSSSGMHGGRHTRAEMEEEDEEEWEPPRKDSSKKPSQQGNGGGGGWIPPWAGGGGDPDLGGDDSDDRYRRPKGKGKKREGKRERRMDNPTDDEMERMVTAMARAMKTTA